MQSILNRINAQLPSEMVFSKPLTLKGMEDCFYCTANGYVNLLIKEGIINIFVPYKYCKVLEKKDKKFPVVIDDGIRFDVGKVRDTIKTFYAYAEENANVRFTSSIRYALFLERIAKIAGYEQIHSNYMGVGAPSLLVRGDGTSVRIEGWEDEMDIYAEVGFKLNMDKLEVLLPLIIKNMKGWNEA